MKNNARYNEDKILKSFAHYTNPDICSRGQKKTWFRVYKQM